MLIFPLDAPRKANHMAVGQITLEFDVAAQVWTALRDLRFHDCAGSRTVVQTLVLSQKDATAQRLSGTMAVRAYCEMAMDHALDTHYAKIGGLQPDAPAPRTRLSVDEILRGLDGTAH